MSIFAGFALRLRLRRSHRLLNSDPSGLGGYIVLLNGRTMLRNQYAALSNEQRKPSFKFGTSDELGSVVPRTKSNVAKTIIDPTTATDAATRIRNTATINPLIIAIRLGFTRGVVHSPKGANPSEHSVR